MRGLRVLVKNGCAWGCAWVVRRLSWALPVRTKACRNFPSTFPMTPYYTLALSIKYFYYYFLRVLLLPITTPSYPHITPYDSSSSIITPYYSLLFCAGGGSYWEHVTG